MRSLVGEARRFAVQARIAATLTVVTAITLVLVASASASTRAPVTSLDRGATTGRAVQLATIHPEGNAAQRGIGPVRLEEPQSNVTRTLGAGHKVMSGSEAGESFSEYRYHSGSITIEVAYGKGLVTGIDTTSPDAIMFGHRLTEGLSAFKSILHGRHGWRVDSCNHRVFTALAPGGPGTGIEWDAGKLKLAQIDVGGVLDDCALL